MAKLYGMLPSEIANKATTYDLMVTDILASYEHYMSAKNNPESINDFYDVGNLQKLLEKTREQNN